MRIIFLGTAGYHPNDKRQTSCIFLPEAGVVLDAGTGMFRLRDHWDGEPLDIFLSHAHLDHVVGLTYLLDIVYGKSSGRITVRGDAVKLNAVRECLLSEHLFPAPLPCEFEPLQGSVTLAGGGTVDCFPLEHPGGALGFRLALPACTIAYVTDTTASDSAPYLEHIRGVDVLIHECNFPDSHARLAARTGHSHTSQVARLARAAAVGRLILTHINPLATGPDPVGLDVARAIFPRTEVARDGLIVDV